MREASPSACSANNPGRGCGFPSSSQHQHSCPSLALSSPSALASLLATYTSISCHLICTKPTSILRSPSSMVLHGAGCIQISHRFSKDFTSSSLLTPMSVSPQCPETPETHPSSYFSFSGLGDVFIHMDSSLYSLPCSTIELEVANPTYQWVRDRPGKVLTQPQWALLP